MAKPHFPRLSIPEEENEGSQSPQPKGKEPEETTLKRLPFNMEPSPKYDEKEVASSYQAIGAETVRELFNMMASIQEENTNLRKENLEYRRQFNEMMTHYQTFTDSLNERMKRLEINQTAQEQVSINLSNLKDDFEKFKEDRLTKNRKLANDVHEQFVKMADDINKRFDGIIDDLIKVKSSVWDLSSQRR